MVTVLGSGDSLLRVIETAFPAADIHVRGNEISAVGDPREVALVQRLFDEMMLVLRTGQPMTEDAVERSIAMLRASENGTSEGRETPAEVLTQNILSSRGRTIRPKTLNQKRYVDAIDKHTIVFGIGPAGTGKTYLAMAKAVQALQSKQVNRIILTRPAVEAGERLGFLPGTLYEKIDPYLRPLYDALHDMLDPDSIPKLMAAGTIEVAPLAYMRGRAQPLFTNVLTPDGWRPTEVAARAQMTKQAANRLIRHLERRGYLTLEPDPSDQRARIVRLTDRGWALIAAIRRIVEQVEVEWSRRLGPGRFRALRAALKELGDL